LDYTQLNKSIDNGAYQPIYFLQGENTYYIDDIANKLLNSVLKESEKDFNQTILYGKDTSVDQITDYAKRYPVMSTYQLIIVREAQHLSRAIDKLENYFKQPVLSTILVFCYKGKKIDKRKSYSKILATNNFVIDFDPIKEYQLPDWIKKNAKKKGLKIEQKASLMIAEFIGNDLALIDKNLNKLKLLIDTNEIISIDLVQKHIGFSKDFNLFELTNSIAVKDVKKAMFIAQHFGRNSKSYPIILTIGHLYGFFTKLLKFHFYSNKMGDKELSTKIGVHPFFLKQYTQASKLYSKLKLSQIISELRYYDLMSKGVYYSKISEEEILKELIFKIVN
tara:strand:- start:3318 stop:4322 length:1005 start_codon:yes stop_codon:yes gene_type:complete